MSDPGPEGGYQPSGTGPDPQQQVAAGWFPVNNGVLRYWDGAAWTEHTAPDPNTRW